MKIIGLGNAMNKHSFKVFLSSQSSFSSTIENIRGNNDLKLDENSVIVQIAPK